MVGPPSSFSLLSVGSIVACHTHSLATALCVLWVVKVEENFHERDMDRNIHFGEGWLLVSD